MIELYDVGRVITGPFKAGYDFVASDIAEYFFLDEDCIRDFEALENVRAFHKDRSRSLHPHDFDVLTYAWINAIKKGVLKVNPEELVYKDVKPRFEKVKARGDDVWLFTSGNVELTDLLIGGQVEYDKVLIDYDRISDGSFLDKNNSETYGNIWDLTKGKVIAFFEDKPGCLLAAHEGFKLAGGSPVLYFVDRDGIVAPEKIEEMKSKGIVRITNFYEIRD